jgi:putative tricarboxylic transport membrane protein
LLIPLVSIFALIGAFASEGSFAHLLIAFGFGVGGYFLNKCGFPLAPIALSLILGPIAETSFRTALIRSQGSMSIFFTRPISLVFILLSVVSIFFAIFRKQPKGLTKRKKH